MTMCPIPNTPKQRHTGAVCIQMHIAVGSLHEIIASRLISGIPEKSSPRNGVITCASISKLLEALKIAHLEYQLINGKRSGGLFHGIGGESRKNIMRKRHNCGIRAVGALLPDGKTNKESNQRKCI